VIVFVVDTNLLVFAAIRETPDHEAARSLVEEWRLAEDLWFITWPIVYEFLRVTTHRALFDRPLRLADGWRFIQSLLMAHRLGFLIETDHHPEILGQLIRDHPRAAGNLMHDLHMAALMKEHGVSEIRTADTDFHQFDFLRVVNPLPV